MKTIIFAGVLKKGIMKKVLSILAIAACWFSISCSQASGTADGQKSTAAIEFETTEHDFGTLPQGGNGTFEFIFKNTGKDPLVLNNVRSSCGCTVPEWPKGPVKKGDKGVVKVSYNTRITGNFSKSISVYSNAGEGPVVLIIKGKVEAAAK
jgi:hypothetical protein